ncbi:upf0658 golgi apparatus membrane protein [Lichtheimia corymbifera JMRC:FSU:9682]|uniref:Upf0658 golgi apparatus membrane protein n=1 Tax=Lichtheimia corymbifera JMRC:FSU:9682 TaxID=1263082 RepID=A0A068S0U7_9FUNG|nr:upf0658 golgi apparatus membrane protein [Lichtheimia corymbifera JMRC:FSU:9682]CDH59615.1 upf0658 golgi apparatus membrane protein [Lichtheimia corymbifera JMRC:FSU:9682]
MSTESFAFDSDPPSRKASDYSPEQQRTKWHFWSGSRYSLILVLATLFEAAVVIALESVVFAKFVQNHANKALGQGIPVYLIIFIICQVYQVGIAWDAVRMQNTIQIIAFILLNLCCLLYGGFQFQQISEALNDLADHPGIGHDIPDSDVLDYLRTLITKLLIANVVVIGICELIYLYLGARLYQEFGWRIYKKIGADPEIRNMYRWYQILLTILKIDMFFFLGYSIQYLVLVLKNNDYEFPLTIVALPLTCLFLFLAVYAVRHESKWMVAIFFVGLAAGCAYFIFKIYRIFDPDQPADKYKNIKNFLTFFASVSLALIVLTIINGAICWSNFNKGLKSHLLRDKGEATFAEHQGDRTLSLD